MAGYDSEWGPLAHLLRNRFYVGEVVYQGKVHSGEHEPIINSTLFEAVQTKLATSATARQLRLKGSPAILAGRIFDDRGNRMTPTHTNKRGARYRYYVSHALLQRRNDEAGSVPRVPAPEIENVVLKALRDGFSADEGREPPTLADERNRIERQLDRVVVQAGMIEIHLARSSDRGQSAYENGNLEGATPPRTVFTVPWSGAVFGEVKGILHTPSPSPRLSTETRDALLSAIAKARIWIDELVEAPLSSLAEIAKREGKVERHIRLLAPLAFVSPRLISEIIHGTACPNLTVTGLAKALAYSWAEQENYRSSNS